MRLPKHWPEMSEWEIGLCDQVDDELYEEFNPYGYREEQADVWGR